MRVVNEQDAKPTDDDGQRVKDSVPGSVPNGDLTDDAQEAQTSDAPPIPAFPDTPKREKKENETWRHPLGSTRELAGIGIEIVASIIGLGAVGWLIDRWAGTTPFAMTAGLILGLIGGMYNSVKKALRITGASPYDDHEDRRKENDRNKADDDV